MAGICHLQSVEHYLPMRREVKVYQRRKVPVDKPIFPGYLFAAFDIEGRSELLKTNHIVRIIEPDDDTRLLFELEQVRKALDVDPTLGAANAIRSGYLVRIKYGPFQGIEGIVTSLRSGSIRLNVELIGRAAAMDIDPDLLEILDREPVTC